MSRISTPTGLGVNPNVPMSDMQAPTIVYGAEGMDESALLQYEQLTNVLQAGVQATATFGDVATKVAEMSRRKEILKFQKGLSQAESLVAKREAKTGIYDDTEVREYISGYTDSQIDEIAIAINDAKTQFNKESIRRRAQAEIDAARKKAELEKEAEDRETSEILQFNTGLSEAKRIDAESLTETGQSTNKAEREFLLKWQWSEKSDRRNLVNEGALLDSAVDDAEIALQLRALQAKREEEEAKAQAKMNSHMLSSSISTTMTYMVDNWQTLNPQTQELLLNSGSDPTRIIDLILATMPEETRKIWQSIDVVDKAELVDKLSDNVSSFNSSIRQIRKKVDKEVNARKIDRMIDFVADDIAATAVSTEMSDTYLKDMFEYVSTNLRNTENVSMRLDSVISTSELDAGTKKILEEATSRIIQRGSLEQINAWRTIIEDPSIKMDSQSRDAIVKKLESALFDKTNTSLSTDLNAAIDSENIDAVRTMETRLDSLDSSYIKETDRNQLRERIDSASRTIGRAKISNLSANMQSQQLSPNSLQAMIANPAVKDQALADYQEMLLSWRTQGKDAYGNTIEIMSIDDVAKAVSQYETILNNEMRRAVAPSVVNATDEAISMFRGVPTEQAIDQAGQMFMPAARQVGGLDQGRFDVIFGQWKDTMTVRGILPGTAEYSNALRELSRRMQRDVFPRSFLTPGGQRAVGGYEAAAVDTINQYLQKSAPGSPLITDLSPMDTDSPAVSTLKGNARVSVEIARLRFASMATDSSGARYSTAISDFRATLNSLIGPNLQARIPVEVYDAYKIWNDPRIDRNEVFGTDSPNGTRIARLMSAMDIVKDRPNATLEDLISAAGLIETFDPGNLGWKAITRNEQDMNMHARRFEEITEGVTIKDSTLWLRREYATNFERLSTDNFGDQAAARAQVTELLSERVIVANGSVLPQADIGSNGAAYVEDMAKVLTGRDDAAFVVVGYDNAGRYLYALRDQDGNRIVEDANGNPIEPMLYTTDRVYTGQEGMFSLSSDEFVAKVKRFHATEGIRTPSQRTGRPKPAVKTKQEELQERFNFGTME